MKKLFKRFFLHYCAAQAMQGILSNEKLYSAIFAVAEKEKEEKDREENMASLITNYSYLYAREMAKNV